MIDIKLSLLSQMSPQLCASNQQNGPEPDGRVRYGLAVVIRATGPNDREGDAVRPVGVGK